MYDDKVGKIKSAKSCVSLFMGANMMYLFRKTKFFVIFFHD